MITRQYCARSGASTSHSFSIAMHATEVVHRRGDVVGAVRPGHDLRIAVLLAELLDTPVEVSDDRIAVGDDFAVETENHPEHAVRARMLRSHVQDQLVRAIRPSVTSSLIVSVPVLGGSGELSRVDPSLTRSKSETWRAHGTYTPRPVQRVRTRPTVRSVL